MLKALLVANRGEIARRIFRTCREVGIATVAVYSDADARAPHVREADLAVRLPGSASSDTYLRGDLIVRAALDAGADAVHPGYGFLSENAGFAQAVIEAGLTWIGPSPAAIEDMGSKTRAKELMVAAGVPVLGAVHPETATPADLPLLIKAAAGGGGRGMRIVRELSELPDALARARAEAAASFDSDEVFCEPYVERGRHVEVQILADAAGTVWTLGERDCSLQRRHQKVIEETPAPGGLRDETRRALADAAAAGAKAIDYLGAGTAEFLLAPDGRFFFLEMNTRLQVEHPVTECVTGLDLVAWQLRIAEGRTLPPEPPTPRGHAIEARLYAEDPAHDWQPRTGTVCRFDIPELTGIRVDSGVEAGSVVGVEYDAMLAKVIAWAETREEAARLLGHALGRARIHGLTTSRELLVNVVSHPAFLDGDVHTAFLSDHAEELLAAPSISPLAPLAAALADAASYAGPQPSGLPSGWRNLASQPQVKRYLDVDGTEHEARYRLTRDGLRADGLPEVRLISNTPDRVILEERGVRRTFDVAMYDDAVYVDGPGTSVALTRVSRFPDPAAKVDPGSLLAPMPGTVARVTALEGATVTAGQPLLWLEAMKMEHLVSSPTDGVLTQLHVQPGQQVSVGTILAVVEPKEGPQS
jgi:propionyl-CoA carboxylase alpha chain